MPNVWVSVTSAVPQLLLHLTLHFPGCSPVLPAGLRSFAITLIFKKKSQKPFWPPRGKFSWELLACALQLKFHCSRDTWDVGWEAWLLLCALQGWHMWEKACRVSSVPARLCLDPRGDEELQTLRVWVYSGTTARECGV